MKKIMTIMFVGLLFVSMFSMFAPQAKAESAYLANIVQLTTNPYDDRGVGWSPDSSKITYSAFADSWYRNIWVMDSDGSNKKQLTFGNVVDDAPAYSPDGTKIVFMRYGLRGIDGSDLMMMNADGTNIQQLTSTGLHRGEPRWSHDGQKLAFYYGGAGTPTWEIHIMNADGTNEVTVVSSTSPESAMNPAWSPDDTKLVYTMDDGIWTVNTSPPYQTTHVFQTSSPTTYAVYSPDGKYIMYASGVYGQLQDLYLIDVSGNFIAQLTYDTKFGYFFDWSPDGQYIAFNSISSGNYDIWRAKIVITGLTTLAINVFDESGFPPASVLGANRLADVPIRIYTLDDVLVASGSSDSSGTASFSLDEGTYKINYGSRVSGRFGVASKIVDVSGASLSIDLYCFQVTYHIYAEGGPYELNYIDLDTSSDGYQDAMTVQSGQQINAEFSWWELETVNWPVWLVSAFGSWSPTSSLGNLASGCASPSSHNLYTIPLTFTAPTTPGTYEVRLVGVLDYDWPDSFYTAAHYQPSLGRDTGITIISKALDGPYGTGTIIVGVGNQPPSAPRNLEAESLPSSVKLTWKEPSDTGSSPVQSYKIYRGTSSEEETFLASVDVTTLEYLDNSVSANNLYYYYVKAVSAAGESPDSNEVKQSSLESTKGIEIVLKLDEFKTKGTAGIAFIELFSIQQNFIIPIDRVSPTNHLYLMQNVINVVRIAGVGFMCGGMQVWEMRDGTWSYGPIASTNGPWYGLQTSLVMRSTIEQNILTMDNNFWTFEFTGLPLDSWINTSPDLVQGKDTSPEIVPVGFGYFPIPFNGYFDVTAHVDFDEGTRGHADSYVRIGESESTWLRGKIRTLPNPSRTLTKENSTGLTWDDQIGDFHYESSEYIEQGFSFEPNYEAQIVIPPVVPSHPAVPITSLMFYLHCPANLSLYDSLRRHVGYNLTTHNIDVEIPNTLYLLSESSQLVIIFGSSDIYDLQVIGTGDGICTLEIFRLDEVGKTSILWNSTDNVSANTLLTYTVSAIGPQPLVIEWEQIFRDVKRGTMLKISTDDKYFQFITPDKAFEVKYDPKMYVRKNVIAINYKDNEIVLCTIAIDTRIDFCIAYAKDVQTGKIYWLMQVPKRSL